MKFCNALVAFVLFIVNTRQENVYISLSKRCTLENIQDQTTSYAKRVKVTIDDEITNTLKYFEELYRLKVEREITNYYMNQTHTLIKDMIQRRESILEDFGTKSRKQIRKVYEDAYKKILEDKEMRQKNVEGLSEFMVKLADVTWYVIMKYIEYVVNKDKRCIERKKTTYIDPEFEIKARYFFTSYYFESKLINEIVRKRSWLLEYYNRSTSSNDEWEIYKSLCKDGYFKQLIDTCTKSLNMFVKLYDPNYKVSKIMIYLDEKTACDMDADKSLLSNEQLHCIANQGYNKVTNTIKIYQNHIYQTTQFTHHIKNIYKHNPDGPMQVFFEISYYDSIFLILNEYFGNLSVPVNFEYSKKKAFWNKARQKLYTFIFYQKFNMFTKNYVRVEDVATQAKQQKDDTTAKAKEKIVIILGYDWKLDLNSYFEDLSKKYEFCEFVKRNQNDVVKFCLLVQQELCRTIYDELIKYGLSCFDFKNIVYFPYAIDSTYRDEVNVFNIDEHVYENIKFQLNALHDKLALKLVYYDNPHRNEVAKKARDLKSSKLSDYNGVRGGSVRTKTAPNDNERFLKSKTAYRYLNAARITPYPIRNNATSRNLSSNFASSTNDIRHGLSSFEHGTPLQNVDQQMPNTQNLENVCKNLTANAYQQYSYRHHHLNDQTHTTILAVDPIMGTQMYNPNHRTYSMDWNCIRNMDENNLIDTQVDPQSQVNLPNHPISDQFIPNRANQMNINDHFVQPHRAFDQQGIYYDGLNDSQSYIPPFENSESRQIWYNNENQ